VILSFWTGATILETSEDFIQWLLLKCNDTEYSCTSQALHLMDCKYHSQVNPENGLETEFFKKNKILQAKKKKVRKHFNKLF